MCITVVYLVVVVDREQNAPQRSAHSTVPDAWAHYRDEFSGKNVLAASVQDASGNVLERAI